MSKLLVRFLVYSVGLTLPLCAGAPVVPQPEPLTIFVKGQSEALDFMRAEVARLLEPTGLSVEWKRMSERRAGEDFARLVTVELRGQCSAMLSGPRDGATDVRALASTAIVDGRVLPFSAVQCDSLRRVLSPVLAASRRELWPALMGRAMGRVFAHELFHMLAQTKTHHAAGVSKPCFTVSDLTSEHFAFDSVSVAQLRPVAAEPSPSEPADDNTGGR